MFMVVRQHIDAEPGGRLCIMTKRVRVAVPHKQGVVAGGVGPLVVGCHDWHRNNLVTRRCTAAGGRDGPSPPEVRGPLPGPSLATININHTRGAQTTMTCAITLMLLHSHSILPGDVEIARWTTFCWCWWRGSPASGQAGRYDPAPHSHTLPRFISTTAYITRDVLL